MTATAEPTHGKYWTYNRLGCRCNECVAVNRRVHAVQRARRYRLTEQNGGVAPVAVHNASTYRNWGCRCAPCTAACAASSQRNRDRAKAGRVAT